MNRKQQMITQDELHGSTASLASRPLQPLLLTAYSVAGGSWLLAWSRAGAVWVDVTVYRDASPLEAARVAALARTLLLASDMRNRRLCPSEVHWLLAEPGRVACLIDLLGTA